MISRTTLLACLVFCLPAAAQQDNPTPAISGYVTAIDPSGAFDVEGVHIHVSAKTAFTVRASKESRSVSPITPAGRRLGESMDIFGRLDSKRNTIEASRIVAIPATPATVNGTGVIDLIPAAATPADEHVVRADGYLLRLTPKTSFVFNQPIKSVDDLGTNVWITYHGVQQPDGRVLVEAATLSPNTVKHAEDNLRGKNEYDPAGVDAESKQGFLSKNFLGIDPKLIPPYVDSAMQERVNRIGRSLIPAFQRALPESDATKIDFRFHLIDSTHWRDAVSLPSGIILVPRQVVERLQNDSQLATVLADNIATVMEKQTLRILPASHKLSAAEIAGAAGGVFVPGLGVATSLAAGGVQSHLIARQEQQSGRVSLCLLEDAGYDITQAPLAWWLLAPKKPKPVEKVHIPARAATLYMALGSTWKTVLYPSQP